jgi:hypothetical protein
MAESPAPRRAATWRPLLRALHRDAGYLVVGLTVIYALSGLAVNHVADWDPNFHNAREVHQVTIDRSASDEAQARDVLRALSIRETPREIYRRTPALFDIVLDHRTLHVHSDTGRVVDDGQKPRFLLRVANWLHLNRGKRAWTYVADAYAITLLGLALSGMFMLAGRKGILGRGAVFVAIGIAVPMLYVTCSGGP